jgi:hypothetical protein
MVSKPCSLRFLCFSYIFFFLCSCLASSVSLISNFLTFIFDKMISLLSDDRRQRPIPNGQAEKPRTFFDDLVVLGNDWWGELLSSLCSFGCVALLVLVLREFDQKKLSQWPFDFSLNTTVSLLTTLAKLALMVPVTECISQLKWLWFTKSSKAVLDLETYDSAIRGPLGCVKFLVKLPRP